MAPDKEIGGGGNSCWKRKAAQTRKWIEVNTDLASALNKNGKRKKSKLLLTALKISATNRANCKSIRFPSHQHTHTCMTTGAVHVLYTACTYCGDVSTWQSGTLTISIHIIWWQEVSQSVSPQSHLCLSHPWSNTMVRWHLPLTHHKSTDVWQTTWLSVHTVCVKSLRYPAHPHTGCLWASEGWHWSWDDMPISLGWIQMSICRPHGSVIKSRDLERLWTWTQADCVNNNTIVSTNKTQSRHILHVRSLWSCPWHLMTPQRGILFSFLYILVC